MELEKLRSVLFSKKEAVEDMPFGPGVLVYKVSGKMFALIAWNEAPLRINLKCNPDKALHFRAMFKSVKPGYHMNKTHWNTVEAGGDVSDDLLAEMIDESYELVVKGLKKSERTRLLGEGA